MEDAHNDTGEDRAARVPCAERNADWFAKIDHIQEAGYVFVLQEHSEDSSRLRLMGVSANVSSADWWSNEASAEDFIGSDISSVLSNDFVRHVQALVRDLKHRMNPGGGNLGKSGSADLLPFPETNYKCLACKLAPSNPGVYLLEIEERKAPHNASRGGTVCLADVARVMRSFTPNATPDVLTAAVCNSLMRSVTGYDRIMVYRFDKDKSGEVVHEALRPGADVSSSYLKLRFPASDIPPMARKLLLLNKTRFICDTYMKGAALQVHPDFNTGKKLDLSMSSLRAPAQCHLEYLQNMGVKASLAVAIAIGDELWGMFSFHSYTRAVIPTTEERTLVEMAASVAGMTLARYGREKTVTASLTVSKTLAKIGDHIKIREFLSAENQVLLNILGVDTIVLCEHARSVTVYGDNKLGLDLLQCTELFEDDRSGNTLHYHTKKDRGIACFSVRSFLVAFVRGSAKRHIAWAGKPDPPLVDERRLHPRASFEKFVENSPIPFPPWSAATRELLGVVRHGISCHMYAEALPADLEEVFAHVSHELRTPFHGVMGSLEMLQDGMATMTLEQRQIINSAIDCGNSMLSTLTDILDIAKDRSNSNLSCTAFFAWTPIIETMSAMNQFATRKSIELTNKADKTAGELTVKGDYRRIKHIIQNLVNNAIKFTPREGKVEASLFVFDTPEKLETWWSEQATRFESECWKGVRVGKDCGNDSGGDAGGDNRQWVVYTVEDTGVGVSKGDMPVITSAFRQLSHGASKEYAGTGLGLHISHDHIRLMSGGLGIASTPNTGTMFACAIPVLVNRDAITSAVQHEESADLAKTTTPPHMLTFLVVDDQAVNVKLLQHRITKTFEDSKLQVITATDGQTAIQKWEAEKRLGKDNDSVFAGVFTDFHMPNMNGMECTKSMRFIEAKNGWTRTPIMGCTADPTEHAAKQFTDAGGDEVLCKPWRKGDVGIMCRRMIAKALESQP